MKIKSDQLYLKPDEAKFIAMAVLSEIETLQDMATDQRINWNPAARKNLKDMIAAGTTLKIKLQKLNFDMKELPPYLEGDQDDFVTKES